MTDNTHSNLLNTSVLHRFLSSFSNPSCSFTPLQLQDAVPSAACPAIIIFIFLFFFQLKKILEWYQNFIFFLNFIPIKIKQKIIIIFKRALVESCAAGKKIVINLRFVTLSAQMKMGRVSFWIINIHLSPLGHFSPVF